MVYFFFQAYQNAPVQQFTAAQISAVQGMRVIFDAAGKLQVVRGPVATADKIRSRLRTFLREWFMDQRFGFPWFQMVFRKAPDRALVEMLFRRCIQTTPGVKELLSLSLRFDQAARKLYVTARCVLHATGYTLEMRDEPFDLVSRLAA